MLAFHEQRTYKDKLPIEVFISGELNFLAHWHTEVELIYILEGSHSVGINNQTQTLEKGDFAICSSGDIHYYDGSDTDVKKIITIFKPDFIGYPAGWPQNLRFISPFIKRTSFCDNPDMLALMDKIEELLLDAFREFSKQQVNYVDYIKSKLLEICVLAIRNFPTGSFNTDENNFKKYNLERMQKTLQFIEENYTGNLTLEDLAMHANLSYFYFSRLFKNTVGMSFKEYINRKRIQLAESLLGRNNMSVTQIAFECGFESIRTFYRSYKALKGKSPGMIKATKEQKDL